MSLTKIQKQPYKILTHEIYLTHEITHSSQKSKTKSILLCKEQKGLSKNKHNKFINIINSLPVIRYTNERSFSPVAQNDFAQLHMTEFKVFNFSLSIYNGIYLITTHNLVKGSQGQIKNQRGDYLFHSEHWEQFGNSTV